VSGGFDEATAVTAAGGGFYDATLSPAWAIGDRPHGGYLLALVSRAAADAVTRAGAGHSHHPHPQTTSALFLASPRFGPAHVEVEILRSGRSVSHAQATLVQDGRPCVRALHVFGRLHPDRAPDYLDETPPPMPAFEDCAPRFRSRRARIGEIVDVRFDPATLAEGAAQEGGAGFRQGRAELRAWLRFGDGREPDPLSLLFTLDALPPVSFALGQGGWTPTLELTAYVRALPAPGPLRVRQRGRLLQDGRLDEVCDVWDSAGRLVGQASQLAAVRTRR
jgi:hypothetical protein